MNELSRSLSETLSRLSEEQQQRLKNQDRKIAELEQEVQGCRDLLSELKGVLRELGEVSGRLRGGR